MKRTNNRRNKNWRKMHFKYTMQILFWFHSNNLNHIYFLHCALQEQSLDFMYRQV